mgnify:CR=1 FL=1
MRVESERILDMLEAIERIRRHAARGRAAFEHDELIQTWIVHHLQIIGEAAARMSSSFRDAHPAIPWAQVIAMRNVLVHDYFGIDLEEVWQAVERDLPRLEQELRAIASRAGRRTP